MRSSPAGHPRPWERDRNLYIPEVRFVAIVSNDGRTEALVMSHRQFVDLYEPQLLANGFFGTEVLRTTRRFGNIAHVLSTYESRYTIDGPVIGRGVNSINLFYDGVRWWIASAVWDEERPGNPIPAEFLPIGRADDWHRQR